MDEVTILNFHTLSFVDGDGLEIHGASSLDLKFTKENGIPLNLLQQRRVDLTDQQGN